MRVSTATHSKLDSSHLKQWMWAHEHNEHIFCPLTNTRSRHSLLQITNNWDQLTRRQFRSNTVNAQAAGIQTCTIRVRESEKHHIWRSLLETSTTRMTLWPLGWTERQTESQSTKFGAKDDWIFLAYLHDSSCWAEKKNPKSQICCFWNSKENFTPFGLLDFCFDDNNQPVCVKSRRSDNNQPLVLCALVWCKYLSRYAVLLQIQPWKCRFVNSSTKGGTDCRGNTFFFFFLGAGEVATSVLQGPGCQGVWA